MQENEFRKVAVSLPLAVGFSVLLIGSSVLQV